MPQTPLQTQPPPPLENSLDSRMEMVANNCPSNRPSVRPSFCVRLSLSAELTSGISTCT